MLVRERTRERKGGREDSAKNIRLMPKAFT